MVKRSKNKRKRLSAQSAVENSKKGFFRTSVDPGPDTTFFKLEKDVSRRIDVIPYVVKSDDNPEANKGDDWYERTYWVHKPVGPNNNSYVCPAKTHNKPCPICEKVEELSDAGEDKVLINSLRPKRRQLWNVIDTESPGEGIQLWDISYHLFGKELIDTIANADEDDGYEYFADIEDGFTLKLGVEAKSFDGNSYSEVRNINFKPRKEPYAEDIIDKAIDLDSILIVLEYDKLKSIFLQIDEDNDERPEKDAPKEEEIQTAEDSGLVKGDTVDHEDLGVCTISRVSRDGTSLLLKDGGGELHKAISVSDVVKMDVEEEEEKPKPSVKKKKTKKAPPKEAEPEDEEWDEDDDDDDDWGEDDE